MFSRIATGRITGAVADLGTSGFLELTGLMLAELGPEPFSLGLVGFGALAPDDLGLVADGVSGFALEVVGLAAEPSLAVAAAKAGLAELVGLEVDDPVFTPAAGGAIGLALCPFAASDLAAVF